MSEAACDERTIPDLVGDLLRAVLGLVRSTARIFGFELRDVSRRIGRRAALLIVSSILAATGLLLVCGAVALLAEELLHVPRWVALGAVGLAIGGAGGLGIRTALRRLGDADVAFPATVAALGEDVNALARRSERP